MTPALAANAPPGADDALLTRRRAILTAPNPGERHDYVVRFRGTAAGRDGAPVRIEILYIPDRMILAEGALDAYLGLLAAAPPEALAIAVLEDINSELVPRWLRVTIGAEDGDGHAVMAEDCQPGWHNDALVSRLGRF